MRPVPWTAETVLAGRYAPLLWFVLLAGFMTMLNSTLNPGDATMVHHGFYGLVFAGSLLFMLVRFGLLAVVVGMTIGNIFWQLPLIADPTSWYFHNTILTALLILGLSGWGLWATLAGRPVLRDELG